MDPCNQILIYRARIGKRQEFSCLWIYMCWIHFIHSTGYITFFSINYHICVCIVACNAQTSFNWFYCLCWIFSFFSFCVFFRGRKGDYYRYLAEFKGADERKEAADQSLKAYEVVFVNHLFLPEFLLFSLLCHFNFLIMKLIYNLIKVLMSFFCAAGSNLYCDLRFASNSSN